MYRVQANEGVHSQVEIGVRVDDLDFDIDSPRSPVFLTVTFSILRGVDDQLGVWNHVMSTWLSVKEKRRAQGSSALFNIPAKINNTHNHTCIHDKILHSDICALR